MNDNAFKAGVEPGGLTTGRGIKATLCLLLSKFDKPIPFSILMSSLTQNGLANYFECTNALGLLIESKAVTATETGYLLTEAGKNIADGLAYEVPVTVKEQASKLLREYLLFDNNKDQHKTVIETVDNGFMVSCGLSDSVSTVFSMSLYAPTLKYAKEIEKNFVLKAENIIRLIITQLTDS